MVSHSSSDVSCTRRRTDSDVRPVHSFLTGLFLNGHGEVLLQEKRKQRGGEERREKEMGEREVAGDNKTRQSVGDITGIGR
jgi:hypothetical protein